MRARFELTAVLALSTSCSLGLPATHDDGGLGRGHGGASGDLAGASGAVGGGRDGGGGAVASGAAGAPSSGGGGGGVPTGLGGAGALGSSSGGAIGVGAGGAGMAGGRAAGSGGGGIGAGSGGAASAGRGGSFVVGSGGTTLTGSGGAIGTGSGGAIGTGSGGAVGIGSGGAAGAGGAPVRGCANPLMIDDMEDGDGSVCESDGRLGGWYVVVGTQGVPSGAVVTQPTPNEVLNATPLGADGRPGSGSLYGFGLSGSGFNTDSMTSRDWALLGANVSDRSPYDASKHRGVTFWARSVAGAFKLRVNFSTTAVRSAANHGSCVSSGGKVCDDSYGGWVDLGDNWKQFALDFGYLRQMGWGVPVAGPDLAHLWTIELYYYFSTYDAALGSAITNPSTFKFLVDDLQFVD